MLSISTRGVLYGGKLLRSKAVDCQAAAGKVLSISTRGVLYGGKLLRS